MQVFIGFSWCVPSAFQDAIDTCFFKVGDILYSNPAAYQAIWKDALSKVRWSMQVKETFTAAVGDGESSFEANWKRAKVMLSDARKEWQGLPKRTFRAAIVRVSYAQVDHDVDARSESEARDIALDRAGNIGFSGLEHHADYQVTAIKEIQDERDLLEA